MGYAFVVFDLTNNLGIAAEKVVNGKRGLRNTLFAQMIKQDIAYHDKLGSGALLTRFASDTEVVKDALTTYIPMCIEASSMVIVGIIYLFKVLISLLLSRFYFYGSLINFCRSDGKSLCT